MGEVCEKIFAGGDKPKEFSKYKTNEFSIPIFSNGEKNKGLYGYTNVARVSKPSITISGRGTIGYSEIRTEPFVPIVRLITLLPNENKIDIHFFHYGLKNINFSNSGSSIPQLTVPMVKDYTFPLPPLKEQQQIVAILDKAFAAIATVKDNAQQNLLNAKQLFESYLQNIFENKGDDWEEKEWNELIEIRSGRNQKEVLNPNGKYPILGSAGKVMNYADKYICEAGATIIGRKGTIDKPLFITTNFWNVDTAFGLIAGKELTKEFLYFFL